MKINRLALLLARQRRKAKTCCHEWETVTSGLLGLHRRCIRCQHVQMPTEIIWPNERHS